MQPTCTKCKKPVSGIYIINGLTGAKLMAEPCNHQYGITFHKEGENE